MKLINSWIICGLVLLLISCQTSQNHLYLLVGSYATADEPGLKVYDFDLAGGTTHLVSETKGISNPSFFTTSTDGTHVWCISEDVTDGGSVNAFSFDKQLGSLQFLNAQKTEGKGPCHIAIAPDENFVVTANYNGGSVSVLPLDEEGKVLPATEVYSFYGSSIDKERQQKSYLHCVTFSPDHLYMMADDLGGDCVYSFSIRKRINLTDSCLRLQQDSTCRVKAGCGPRHLAFHPNGKYAYLINELSGHVVSFEYKSGQLYPFQYILSDTVGGRGSADIHLSPDGKYLYASNRLKADGIAIFRVNEKDGLLTKVGYQLTGPHPRNFVLTPDGHYLLVACRDSNEIEIYQRDTQSGMLKKLDATISTKKPVCLRFIE